jgi:hypothetical protein
MRRKIITVLLLVGLIVCMGSNQVAASDGGGTITVGVDTGMGGVVKAAPTASPPPGTYTAVASVTLTAAGSSAIYYTGDGTTPNNSTGTRYTSPINITSNTTVMTVAYYTDGTAGPVGTYTYIITPAPPAAAGGGGGGGSPPAVGGVGTVSFYTSPGGVTSSGVTLTSQDGVSTATIPQGTTVKDALGNPLGTITCVPPATKAPVPPAQNALAMYDFGPKDAKFSPDITITMTYDPAKLPTGVTEFSLVIAYYDTASGQWINLTDIVVDPVNHTVSGKTGHFTQFAVLANLIVQPVVTPTPTPIATPTPTKSPSPTVAATPTAAATPSPSLSPAPQPTGGAGQPAPGGINWILWIIIAVVVIAILVLVYLWFVRWRS